MLPFFLVEVAGVNIQDDYQEVVEIGLIDTAAESAPQAVVIDDNTSGKNQHCFQLPYSSKNFCLYWPTSDPAGLSAKPV